MICAKLIAKYVHVIVKQELQRPRIKKGTIFGTPLILLISFLKYILSHSIKTESLKVVEKTPENEALSLNFCHVDPEQPKQLSSFDITNFIVWLFK